jgi:hypothetical protein
MVPASTGGAVRFPTPEGHSVGAALDDDAFAEGLGTKPEYAAKSNR